MAIKKARSSGFKNNVTNYMRYSDTFYDRVTEGNNSYLHARPIHYQLVGADKIGDINSQLESAINDVLERTENHGTLHDLILKQQAQEIKKMNEFVKIYNSNKQDKLEKISEVSDEKSLYRAVRIINGKIKATSGLGENSAKNARRVIDTVNSIVASCISEDNSKPEKIFVEFLKPDEFMGLYEVVLEIHNSIEIESKSANDPFSTMLYITVLRKTIGFLKHNKAKYDEYSVASKKESRLDLDDPALWSILEAIGEKPWGNRNKSKTYASVLSSIKGSAQGKTNQMAGVIDESELAGSIDGVGNDIANYLAGLVQGKVTGTIVGGELDSFKKQQKIDVSWGFETSEGRDITINISSKVSRGKGGVVIHGGGGLDSYIKRFEADPYTRPIAEIFSNNNFRYFYVNEFYGRARSGKMNSDFKILMHNAIKATMPTMMGVKLMESGDLDFNGVDFLSVNRKLIPVSTILIKISENLKNVKEITKGASLEFDIKNVTGRFLRDRYNLLRSLPRSNVVNYYTNPVLISTGNTDAASYMNHIKITMKLTKALIKEAMKTIDEVQ